MLTTPKAKGGLFLASSLCDGLEDNDIKQVTTLLLNKEADPNILIPYYGVTPFHLVIGNDSETFAEEVTKLFLRHGGNPNVRSVEGMTPVHVAAAWGRVAVLELLLANGGDPVRLDDEGRSPFHYAFDGKYYKAISVLGKYCEDDMEEDKKIKFTLAFDKLLINNGNVMAEYVPIQNSNIDRKITSSRKDLEINENDIPPNSLDDLSFTSDSASSKLSDKNTSKLKAAELRLHEAMEREKYLVHEIINQLSTSLKTSSKNKTKKERATPEENPSDFNTSLNISTDELSQDIRDKIYLKKRVRKRSGTPRQKHKLLAQNTNDNAIISPTVFYDLNDSIISKSPNFILPSKVNTREREYFSPRATHRKSEFKAFTPCPIQRESRHLEEFNFRKDIARSTPRRKKKLNRYCAPLRRFKKHLGLRSSEDTSPDSNSLSPDQNRLNFFNYKFDKSVAIRLYENEYDEDESRDSRTERVEDVESAQLNFKRHEDMYEANTEFSLKNLNRNLQFEEKESKDCSEREETWRQRRKFVPKNISGELLRTEDSITSFISVQEEYKYKDPDKGVALVERRVYAVPACKSMESQVSLGENGNAPPQSINLQMDLLISNEALRKKLINLGYAPGPITDTTRLVYLKKLVNLENKVPNASLRSYSKVSYEENACVDQIQPFLTYGAWTDQLDTYRILEKKIFEEFSFPDPSKKWREGTNKTSFNYLLLDSRITKDLPCRMMHLADSEVWSIFLSAIFYVGKGKRSRPYFHLYDAFNAWVHKNNPTNGKLQRILDIWDAGYGVICLYGFQNIIPVEAYTREAAMIDALGIDRLVNCKAGDYYGIMATWSRKEKCEFGRYLLYKMLQILMYEGERQIFPEQL